MNLRPCPHHLQRNPFRVCVHIALNSHQVKNCWESMPWWSVVLHLLWQRFMILLLSISEPWLQISVWLDSHLSHWRKPKTSSCPMTLMLSLVTGPPQLSAFSQIPELLCPNLCSPEQLWFLWLLSLKHHKIFNIECLELWWRVSDKKRTHFLCLSWAEWVAWWLAWGQWSQTPPLRWFQELCWVRETLPQQNHWSSRNHGP